MLQNLRSVHVSIKSFPEVRAFRMRFGCTRRGLEDCNLYFFFQTSYLSELVEGSQETFQAAGLGGTGGRWGPEGTAGNWVCTGCLKRGKHILRSI